MNDGLRTDMFLRYTPETIACACIQLAAKTVERPVILPKSPFPWFVIIIIFLILKV
jgi:cyclin L